jgi:hypothetical protein
MYIVVKSIEINLRFKVLGWEIIEWSLIDCEAV